MSKVLQVVIYKSISDETKLAAYAELAGPAMKAAGAKFLARGIPVAVREEDKKLEQLLLNGKVLKLLMQDITVMDIKRLLKNLMEVQ